MTPAQHYQEAERCLRAAHEMLKAKHSSRTRESTLVAAHSVCIQEAQVHATLALASNRTAGCP